MAEDLQVLIERLQREAVDEGQRRARVIVQEAEAKAATTVRNAEAEALRALERARHDAEAYTERSRLALEQAGRDLLISVGQSIDGLMANLVRESLQEELEPGLLGEMLVKMAEAYAARGGRERRLAVLLSAEDLDAMVELYSRRLADKLPHGIGLRLDNSVVKGFRVALVDEHVEHDLTIDAIAEALTHHLRPHLAKVLAQVAPEVSSQASPPATPPQAEDPSR
ncbi:MAG: hypothetical protein EA416_13735 [Trueperaceae bacterium]|nr:MAG: hypothetical protein EA416_13735 [Trueperaceae bacterium]